MRNCSRRSASVRGPRSVSIRDGMLPRVTKWTVIVGSMAVAVTILVGVVTALQMKAEWWGALGQWAGAVGSVLAVAVALWIANKQAAVTAAQALAEQREKEINQARLGIPGMLSPRLRCGFQ